jgi:hypothetical protein
MERKSFERVSRLVAPSQMHLGRSEIGFGLNSIGKELYKCWKTFYAYHELLLQNVNVIVVVNRMTLTQYMLSYLGQLSEH